MAHLSAAVKEQVTRALASARYLPDDIAAKSAYYAAADDLFVLSLKSGRRVAVLVEDLQHLADAERALVAQVELGDVHGSSLHWEKLDVDFFCRRLSERAFRQRTLDN